MLRSRRSDSRLHILLLHPPSPPLMNVGREWAGGYGTAVSSDRPCYGSDPEYLAVPYMSLLFSASLLEEAGHQVSFVDAQVEALDAQQVTHLVAELAPDLLVSVVNLPSLKGDLALLERVSNAAPQVKVIAVGTVCRGLPEEVLAGKAVIAAVEGDPEVVLPDLAEALRDGRPIAEVAGLRLRSRDGTQATSAPAALSDWATIPTPAYHLAPMHRYEHAFLGQRHRYAQVVTSRGCSFACSYYCPYPFGLGSKVLFRDPSRVVDELTTLKQQFGVSFIIFRDQVFTLRRSHAEAVLDGMLERKLDLNWICETRVDRVDEVVLGKMRAAGCRQINYGLETADPQLFESRAKPGGVFREAREALRLTRRTGIRAFAHLMVGLPGETWESVRLTARALYRLAVDDVGVAIATPYPGTRLYEEASTKGWLLTDDWSRYTGFRPVMRTEHLDEDDLLRAQDFLRSAHSRRHRLTGAVRRRLRWTWDALRRTSRQQSRISTAPGQLRGDSVKDARL